MDHCQLHHREVVQRELFESGGHSATFLEPAHHSLDNVALAVGIAVKGRLPGLGLLGGQVGDHRFDSQDLEHRSDPVSRVGLVAGDLDGQPQRSRPGVGERYGVERAFDVQRLVILAGTGVGSERNGIAASDQVELRPKPAS